MGSGGAIGGRGRDRVLRVARTIVDLAGRTQVEADHLDEALGFRVGASARAAA